MGAEFLQRLGLLPTHMSGRFEPYRLITRSEAAFIVHQALQLEEVEGVIAEVEGRQIALKKAAGDETLVMDLLDETLYVSPGSLTRNTINRDEELKKGQNALIRPGAAGAPGPS